MERDRLVREASGLRERAGLFAAAIPSGRTFPMQETQRLFLHFKSLRPYLDRETQALNDASVRGLVSAVAEAHRRARTS